MKYIHSASNPKVKQWKKLQTKKERDKTGRYLVEGFHLVQEAIAEGHILEIIVDETIDLPAVFDYKDTPVTEVTNEIFTSLSDTETPQGVLAVCQKYTPPIEKVEGTKFLFIDAVQDPGNLGTMIRTADSAGVDAVVVGEGSVDIYNQKVLRSAQGSHFHLPILKGELTQWIEKVQGENIPVYGTALENAKVYTEIQPSGKFALIVGNEGSGVNKALLEKTTANLYIPIYGKSESLNVAVATGILLYALR